MNVKFSQSRWVTNIPTEMATYNEQKDMKASLEGIGTSTYTYSTHAVLMAIFHVHLGYLICCLELPL